MHPGELERIILRVLSEEELCGYDLWKNLSSKGFKFHSNHIYVTLAGMERRGLVSSRWLDKDNGTKAPRKHLYTIGGKGIEEMNTYLTEALNLLMTSYVNFIRNVEDYSGFSSVIMQASASLQMPLPAEGARIVLAIPYHDPLTCYQMIYSLSDTFRSTQLYVITPPEMELHQVRANMTTLHGWRYDMPLRDGFADYLIMEGFPRQVSEQKTVAECARVVGGEGIFIIQVKNAMVSEKKSQYPFFSEYVERLYYDLFRQDREISQKGLSLLLSRHFGALKEIDFLGTTLFYCREKAQAN